MEFLVGNRFSTEPIFIIRWHLWGKGSWWQKEEMKFIWLKLQKNH